MTSIRIAGVCRFCGDAIYQHGIRYVVLHWAHSSCFVAAVGWRRALRRLNEWQVERLTRELANEALATGSIKWRAAR